MAKKNTLRRLAALGATALATTVIAVSGMSGASAATNPYNQVRICAQGDYWASAVIYKDTAGSTVWLKTPQIKPGTCWDTILNTNGVRVRINVGGTQTQNSTPARYIGFGLWNSTAPIALGAEGKFAGTVKLVEYK
ncbi:hypothetical protein [Kineosporia sp. NBRC 101731]|uniref:hypothetical protein n=1 Tax=Kineosporia sp. NBRC 101731 TaxID=3032199 RepID=UPI00249F9DAB|nr:hypothetical protein [Kineosporia sp. NBRC 101731]GLY28869.1 hypothetical protein Kisp02_22340 [Kineosporia sp. NBRC 101731]